MHIRSIFGIVIVLVTALAIGYVVMTPKDAPRSDAAIPTPLADDLIVIEQPLPESVVYSPLKITGRARGTWFFEASFPIVLTNWDGLIIAQAPAQATTDWMTTDWVPFEATLVFNVDTSVSSRGALILRKDNPSGLPQFDDAREMTVFFGK
jgi:hypothetical protein